MAAAGNIANVDSTGNLLALLTALKGTSQTSSTTSNLTAAGANALVANALGSSNGLASIASGEKSAGVYNSTVNTQMTNDLLARVSAQVAAQQAGTTTTTKKNPQISLANIGEGLALAGAKSVLGPVVGVAAKKLGVDNLGDKLSDKVFGAGSQGADPSIGPPSSLADNINPFSSSIDTSAVDPSNFDIGDAFASPISAAGEDIGSSIAANEASGDIVSSVADDTAEDGLGGFLDSIFG